MPVQKQLYYFLQIPFTFSHLCKKVSKPVKNMHINLKRSCKEMQNKTLKK